MIEFLLNNRLIQTEKAASTTLLDFIRYDENLRGTKIGCREGDCGACTILIGTLKNDKVEYRSATSCLTPLPNVHGKHVVTVEGLNLPEKLNQAQQAMVDCSGTQCGFCTPGFIASMCGYALNSVHAETADAISAIDGNICRCTGYKSIERAAAKLTQKLTDKNQTTPLSWLVENEFVPDYFLNVEESLKKIQTEYATQGEIPIGGGTDIYVQKHDDVHNMNLDYLFDRPALNGIDFNGSTCTLKSEGTVTDLIENKTLLEAIPNWYQYLKLVSSTPIRNIGTVAGNFANGSPIGDLTIIFLALNSKITLTNSQKESRVIYLKDFYLGYKTFDLKPGEIISEITFEVPNSGTQFNFDKVCKRQYLDIASVNTACTIKVENTAITTAHFSIGGVGPIPKYLSETNAFLTNKPINVETIQQAQEILQSEITPISDARGTEAYKRLLARQLFYGHFITLFPDSIKMNDLL